MNDRYLREAAGRSRREAAIAITAVEVEGKRGRRQGSW
jgi:hypothetical protein